MLFFFFRFPEFECLFTDDSIHNCVFEVALAVTGAIGDKTVLKCFYLLKLFSAAGTIIEMEPDRLGLMGIEQALNVANQ
jgi:hypothetical protein